MPAKTVQMTGETKDDRDRGSVEALLQHVARYRLSTFAAMEKLPCFCTESPRQLRQILRLCRDAGFLSSATLHSGMRYWFLSGIGAARCMLDESRSGPLSETAKLRAYALLLFCCLSPQPRHRLTATELSQGFSALHRPGMPGTYYFNPTKSGGIGLARVDAGNSGRWDRIIQSVREDISLHIKLPGFRELIAASRFEITVLTVLSPKAERLISDLRSLPDVQRVPVHVVSQTELLPLIASTQRKEECSRT